MDNDNIYSLCLANLYLSVWPILKHAAIIESRKNIKININKTIAKFLGFIFGQQFKQHPICYSKIYIFYYFFLLNIYFYSFIKK